VVEQVVDLEDLADLVVEVMHQMGTHLPTLVVVVEDIMVVVVVEVQVVLDMLLLLIPILDD
tara:strand:+ start:507 stop:689 length:183 start_codon:yes stop_codon:yes gene_type:complete